MNEYVEVHFDFDDLLINKKTVTGGSMV